jgi:hypothetical protein
MPKVFEDLEKYWPELYSEFESAASLVLKKGNDYSDPRYGQLGNLGASIEIGVDPWEAIIIRMLDKWTRLKSFMRNKTYDVEDEGFEDTLRDLGNYCFLCLTARTMSKNLTQK